jgi:hypothetical protein
MAVHTPPFFSHIRGCMSNPQASRARDDNAAAPLHLHAKLYLPRPRLPPPAPARIDERSCPSCSRKHRQRHARCSPEIDRYYARG